MDIEALIQAKNLIENAMAEHNTDFVGAIEILTRKPGGDQDVDLS